MQPFIFPSWITTGSSQESNDQDPEQQQQISIQAQEPGYPTEGPESQYERPRSKWQKLLSIYNDFVKDDNQLNARNKGFFCYSFT